MKYVIKQLEPLCIDYLLNNINAGNVFTILQLCIDCQADSRLMDGCKKFIQCKTEAVIKAESFIKISHECLTLLLEQESLDIAEVRLFEAVCFYFYPQNACKMTMTKFLANIWITLDCWLGKSRM